MNINQKIQFIDCIKNASNRRDDEINQIISGIKEFIELQKKTGHKFDINLHTRDIIDVSLICNHNELYHFPNISKILAVCINKEYFDKIGVEKALNYYKETSEPSFKKLFYIAIGVMSSNIELNDQLIKSELSPNWKCNIELIFNESTLKKELIKNDDVAEYITCMLFNKHYHKDACEILKDYDFFTHNYFNFKQEIVGLYREGSLIETDELINCLKFDEEYSLKILDYLLCAASNDGDYDMCKHTLEMIDTFKDKQN